jgi:hypothetical protein
MAADGTTAMLTVVNPAKALLFRKGMVVEVKFSSVTDW